MDHTTPPRDVRLDLVDLDARPNAGDLPDGLLAQLAGQVLAACPPHDDLLVGLRWAHELPPAVVARLDQRLAARDHAARAHVDRQCSALSAEALDTPAGELPSSLWMTAIPGRYHGAVLARRTAGGSGVVAVLRSGRSYMWPHPTDCLDPLVLLRDSVARALGAPTADAELGTDHLARLGWLQRCAECARPGDTEAPVPVPDLDDDPVAQDWRTWHAAIATDIEVARWFDPGSFARRSLAGFTPAAVSLDRIDHVAPRLAAHCRGLATAWGLLGTHAPGPDPVRDPRGPCGCGSTRPWAHCHGRPAPIAVNLPAGA